MTALSSCVSSPIDVKLNVNSNKRSSIFAVACPSCEYLLHGLGGPVITCPECGEECDIEDLIRRYRARWSLTPLYERMLRPVTVGLLTMILLPGAFAMMISGGAIVEPIGLALIGIVAIALTGVWLTLSVLAVRSMPFGRGCRMLLLLHVTMMGYLVCGVGVFAGLIGLVMLPVAIINAAADAEAIVLCGVVTALGIMSAMLLRPLWKLDQRVGRACLRHSLHERAAEGECGELTEGRQ